LKIEETIGKGQGSYLGTMVFCFLWHKLNCSWYNTPNYTEHIDTDADELVWMQGGLINKTISLEKQRTGSSADMKNLVLAGILVKYRMKIKSKWLILFLY